MCNKTDYELLYKTVCVKDQKKTETESSTKIIWFDEDGNPIWTETYEGLGKISDRSRD